MRVFISYAGADSFWAEWLAEELEQAGHSTTRGACTPEQEPGPDLTASLAFDFLLLVWSPQYRLSSHASAQREHCSGGTLVVRVRECSLPLAETGRCLDLVGLSGSEASAALLQAVESEVSVEPAANKRPTRFPGALPKIWDLPCSRNTNFVGKDRLLEDLHSTLASVSMTALVGPGGIGKTQTALEYAHRYASAYDMVFWIRAGQSVQLTSDYVRLAAILSLPEQNITDQPKLMRAVHDWLSSNPGWLLIFDDVLDPEDLKNLVPSPGGHVLVTSRCRDRHRGVLVEVPGFSRRDAAVYLGQSTGSSDLDGAIALGDALAHNAQALAFAAAMIKRWKISIAVYRQLLPAACTNSPDAIVAAGQVCLDAVSSEEPESWALLQCAIWMSLQNIPKALLHSNPEDALAIPQHLALLESYSLLETSVQAIRIHRSTREIVQARLNTEEQRYWAGVAADRINQKFPSKTDDFRYWPVCSRLMPHVVETLAHAEQLEPVPAAVPRLLNQSGLFELRRAQYSRAEQLLRRALRLGERMYGQGHHKIATYAGNLSTVLKEQGNLDQALALALRALHIDEQVFGEAHVSVAVRCGTLGQILQAQGDLHGALSYYQRALEVGDRVQGQRHQQSAIRSYNLAQAFMLLRDFHGAARFCLRALQTARETFGEDHAKVADFAGTLAQIHRALGDLDLALQYARQAVSINKDFYSPEHWKVAASERRLEQLTLEIDHARSVPDMVQETGPIREPASQERSSADRRHIPYCEP
jgi:tetratricopeptide (TPR) repeat protein